MGRTCIYLMFLILVRLDLERCFTSGEMENITWEALEGAPSSGGPNATALNLTTPQPMTTKGDLEGINLEEVGNWTSMNATNQNPWNERVPWNYIWLLPASLGIFLLCVCVFMTVPHLRKHFGTLNCLTTSSEERIPPDTVHLPLETMALAPTPHLRSAVTHVPRSGDVCAEADPSSPETESLRGTPGMFPGSSNPPKMTSGPPGSGTHVVETITMSPANTLQPSLKQTLVAEASFLRQEVLL